MAQSMLVRLHGALLLLLAAGPASAGESRVPGERIHERHCMVCHSDITGGNPNRIYTRENRRINSRAALREQVARCHDQFGTPWRDERVEEVVDYLDQRFYHFTPANGDGDQADHGRS